MKNSFKKENKLQKGNMLAMMVVVVGMLNGSPVIIVWMVEALWNFLSYWYTYKWTLLGVHS